MALWYLLTSVRTKGPTGAAFLAAGALINDAVKPLGPIQAAGGVLAPSSYPNVAAAAAIVSGKGRAGLADGEGDRYMLAGYQKDVVAVQQNRVFQTGAAGATVAAGAAIAPNVLFTPKASGKVKVMAWASIQALAAGTFTPVLKQGSTTLAAPAKYTGVASDPPGHVYLEAEVDGLTIGTPITFSWVTTAGDATVTLGNGASGVASRLEVQEMF